MVPAITVVVPVYNREFTITTCVKSILASTLKEIELIIIDDGSTDNSHNICKTLAELDHRIKIITQPNKGVSAARNLGLRNAKGQWITFVDSDDAVTSDYYKNMMEVAEQATYDLLWVGHAFGNKKGGQIIPNSSPVSIKHYDLIGNTQIINWIFSDYEPYQNQFFNVWDKIFRTDILRENNITFREEITLAEDQIFILEYLKVVNHIFYCNNPYYITINWSKKERPSGLGEKLRKPEYYWFIQKENYNAFEELYRHSSCEALKKYQINYIFDRPLTRILYKYILLSNLKKSRYKEIKNLFSQIRVMFKNEIKNMHYINDSQIRKHAFLIIHRPFIYTYIALFIQRNWGYYTRRIFNRLFRNY